MNVLEEEFSFFKKRLSSLEPLLTLKQRQIDAILEVTRAINQNIPLEALVRILEAVIYAQLNIKRSALIIKDNKGSWNCISSFGVEANQFLNLNFNKFIEQYLGFSHITEIDKGEEFSYVIPVINKDEKIAFAFLGGLDEKDAANHNEHLKFVQTITNMICVAHENKRLLEQETQQKLMQKDIMLASIIQSVLVPRKFPVSDKFKISAFYKPFRDIGGDYYDFIKFSEDEYVLCMCDISGKGIAAAMIMSNFQANLRLTLKQGGSLPQIITELNTSIYEVTKGDAFITGFFAKYNHKLSTLKYVNAGHNPPLLYQSGMVRELHEGCTILGAIKKLPPITANTIFLEHDSFLLTYTDGLTEASNEFDILYGPENLKTFLEENHKEDVEMFIIKLITEIQQFSGKDIFDDDISLMCFRFN